MKLVDRRWAYAILAAVVLIFFGRLLVCDFTWWDDQETIHQNPWMNPPRVDSFVHFWREPTMAIYIPLTYTVWGLLGLIARVPPGDLGITLNPYIFHGANLLFHIGSAWVTWELLRRLVKNDLAALFGALLWAVHPVQVESVGWLSGLKDVLAGGLSIASLWQFVVWRQVRLRRAYWLSYGLFVLAMLAKPSAMTTPLMIVAIDRLALGTAWRKIAKATSLYFLAVIPIAMVARTIQPAIFAQYPWWLGPLIAGDSVAFYIVKVLAPLHLTLDYGHHPIAVRKSGEVWYGWLLPAAIWVALYFGARSPRGAGGWIRMALLGFLLFAIAPLHVLGFTGFDFQFISTVADHYLYVAMIGPALIFATVLGHFSRKTVYIAAGLLLLAYGTRAMLQTPVWQNELTLMNHALQVNPKSWTANTNLASYYSRFHIKSAERDYLLAAEKLQDTQPLIEQGLMSVELDLQHFDAADLHARRLIAMYERFYGSFGPPTVPAIFNVINIYFTYHMLDEADRYLKEAKVRDPNNPELAVWRQRLAWVRNDPNYKILRRSTPVSTQPEMSR